MQHSAAFLAVVDDAKTRVKEVTVAQTLARLSANPKAVLVDVREDNEWQAGHAAPGEAYGEGRHRTRYRCRRFPAAIRRSSCIAEGDFGRRWREMCCSGWGTGMCGRWREGGGRGMRREDPRLADRRRQKADGRRRLRGDQNEYIDRSPPRSSQQCRSIAAIS